MKIIVNLILFYICNKKFTQLLILIFKKTLQNKKGTAIDWSNFIFFLLSLLRYPSLQIFILKFGLWLQNWLEKNVKTLSCEGLMRSTGRFFLSSGGAFVETRFPSYRGLYVTLAHSCSSLPPAVHAANTVSYRRTRAAWPTDENCKIASRTIQRVRLAAGIREQKENCRDAEHRRGRWWPPVLRAGALRMLGYKKVRILGYGVGFDVV